MRVDRWRWFNLVSVCVCEYPSIWWFYYHVEWTYMKYAVLFRHMIQLMNQLGNPWLGSIWFARSRSRAGQLKGKRGCKRLKPTYCLCFRKKLKHFLQSVPQYHPVSLLPLCWFFRTICPHRKMSRYPVSSDSIPPVCRPPSLSLHLFFHPFLSLPTGDGEDFFPLLSSHHIRSFLFSLFLSFFNFTSTPLLSSLTLPSPVRLKLISTARAMEYNV